MNNFLKVSLLAAAVAVGLTACQKDEAPAAKNAEVKAEASKPAEAPKADAKSFEEQSGYAIGLSMGRYIANTLERQQELGIKLDNAVILKGVTDGLEKKADMKDEEIQKVLQAYDAKINELTKSKADKDAQDNLKKGEEFLAGNLKKEGIKSTESGLQYQVEKMGDGAKPKATDVVKVHYTGTLIDGTKFDSSVDRGEPATFPLNQVIPGWTEGVQLMPVGSKFKFFLPSKLGYGEHGAGSIPANAVLEFDVELLAIEKPAAEGDAAKADAAAKQ
ncbi:FKBP-type peptidyl-prolyl cis-trans isomerase FkpA [Aeromonas sp. BIGb0405]|uniref:FKBP-type peptidyl-prolyl cis-trans isomerase n=1 Tax=Aeromonas TaxID=642 RepID=UPI001CCF9F9F|nr:MULTISPECIES: FKBP-type peptidyl-prolyl cis-trans isomerase [Aeromonas]MCS3454815.1 FKBP-type peptidyl-prolyl cis-trans isomerase FkpA [Aeromonas sp. BIGb0405]MCS3459783.1 FKBP-type peptidyl-prolyl cis-trans isomerase FkpA [Aeromonas sp. BIGb0445]UBO74962.1 FKBP-type peptidyl-prolyl cis-trans isomerase [Aeromonas rivuli]